jgi:hypothetical protein
MPNSAAIFEMDFRLRQGALSCFQFASPAGITVWFNLALIIYINNQDEKNVYTLLALLLIFLHLQ